MVSRAISHWGVRENPTRFSWETTEKINPELRTVTFSQREQFSQVGCSKNKSSYSSLYRPLLARVMNQIVQPLADLGLSFTEFVAFKALVSWKSTCNHYFAFFPEKFSGFSWPLSLLRGQLLWLLIDQEVVMVLNSNQRTGFYNTSGQQKSENCNLHDPLNHIHSIQ